MRSIRTNLLQLGENTRYSVLTQNRTQNMPLTTPIPRERTETDLTKLYAGGFKLTTPIPRERTETYSRSLFSILNILTTPIPRERTETLSIKMLNSFLSY